MAARWPVLAVTVLACGCSTTQSGRLQAPASGPLAAAHLPARVRRDLRRAVSASGPEQAAGYRLQAVRALLKAGDIEAARALLRQLDADRLNAGHSAMRALLHACLAMQRHRPRAALHSLAQAPAGVGPTMRIRLMQARARAYAAAGQWSQAVTERVRLAPQLSGSRQAANQRAIWADLNHLPFSVVSRPPPPVPNLQGWYALAYLVQADAGEPDQLRYDLGLWHDTYPRHPANRYLLPQLQNGLPSGAESPAVPSSLALLLPLSGPMAPAGRAVAQGFRLAGTGLQVTEYDTHGDAQGAVAAYGRAVQDGADWIIGPLTRDAVEAVAEAREDNVAELALNDLPGQMNRAYGGGTFYQFALGPGADARALARRAMGDGRRRAALLYAATPWGKAASAAFASAFRRLGGRIVASQSYPYHGRHLGPVVRKFLRGNGPRPLWRDMRGPDARPHPQETDMVLLVADSRDARLIHPLLQFYHAVDLPVYATSDVFSGHPAPDKDVDLDGITFCTMPFLLSAGGNGSGLRAAALDRIPGLVQNSPRLVALGADSALLAGHLSGLQPGAAPALQGATGLLGLSEGGRIRRDLPCAQFRHGRPAPLASEPGPAEGWQAGG